MTNYLAFQLPRQMFGVLPIGRGSGIVKVVDIKEFERD
jgi:hypothetical protein